MGWLDAMLVGAPITASTPSPDHDWWYGDAGGSASLSGVAVTPDTALKLSAFYRGVDLIARATAAVPWIITRDLDDDQGEGRAKTHRWYRKLHRRPNGWQTSAEFRYLGQWRVLMRGNFYARIDVERGDEVLTPLDPDRMTVQLVDGPRGRRRGYRFRPERGGDERYVQDEIYHVMGAPRADGAAGLSVVERARVALGRSLAQQEWAARFFGQNGTPPFALKYPAKLSDKAYENLKDSIQNRAAGLANAHKAFILEEGGDIVKLGLSLRDSQFIELDQFGVVDVCRWLGVQPHKVYELARATFSNIEHQAIEFLTDTMDPWFVFWEQAAERDLLGDDETHHVKFVREGLLRADLLARAQAYAQLIQSGVLAENEAREKEGLRKFPGLDEPRRSANMDRGGDPNGVRPGHAPKRRALPPPDDEDDALESRAQAIAMSNAQRVVRKEIATIRTQAERRQGEDWRRWAAEFYGKHVDVLVEALCLTETQARRYGVDHCGALLERGVAVLDDWERDAPSVLAAMALGLA